MNFCLRVIETLSREVILSNCFSLPSEQVSPVKGNNLLPMDIVAGPKEVQHCEG